MEFQKRISLFLYHERYEMYLANTVKTEEPNRLQRKVVFFESSFSVPLEVFGTPMPPYH